MSHLAEEYAKSCGVKIGKPILKPHYYPVVHEKYITIHNDKKEQKDTQHPKKTSGHKNNYHMHAIHSITS